MNADESRKASAFLYFDMPKKDQPTFDSALTKNTGRISKDKVVITMIGDAADSILNNDRNGTFELYNADGYLENKERKHIPQSMDEQTVVIPRAHLSKLIDAMTGDWVMLKAATDYPLAIVGMIGDEYCGAYIAPRIEQNIND